MTDSEIMQTPASDTPTPPSAPSPGVALEPQPLLPDEPDADAADDPLVALQQRSHPFT